MKTENELPLVEAISKGVLKTGSHVSFLDTDLAGVNTTMVGGKLEVYLGCRTGYTFNIVSHLGERFFEAGLDVTSFVYDTETNIIREDKNEFTPADWKEINAAIGKRPLTVNKLLAILLKAKEDGRGECAVYAEIREGENISAFEIDDHYRWSEGFTDKESLKPEHDHIHLVLGECISC